MKTVLKLVISFVMILTVAFGMNVGSAEAQFDFTCDATPSNECVDILEPGACLIVKDSTTKPYNMVTISNVNPNTDARFSVEFHDFSPDYWLEPDTTTNLFFGEPMDHKVCNISDGSHPLISVKYPSYPDL